MPAGSRSSYERFGPAPALRVIGPGAKDRWDRDMDQENRHAGTDVPLALITLDGVIIAARQGTIWQAEC